MIPFYHDSVWIIVHVQSLLPISTQVMPITCSISIIYASPFMSSPSVCLLSVRISVYAYFLFMLTVMCILYFMPISLVYLLPVYSRGSSWVYWLPIHALIIHMPSMCRCYKSPMLLLSISYQSATATVLPCLSTHISIYTR